MAATKGCNVPSTASNKSDEVIKEEEMLPRKAVKREFVHPEGGRRAWTVMVCSFLCNGIIFGIVNSCGSLFVALKARYDELNDPDAATKASLIGAFAIGSTFALSPVSGMLADKFGIRATAFFGGFTATLGLLLSAVFIDHIEVLCFTYGIMFGSGSSLVYTPSLAILGHYFKRRLGVVNGIVASGSSIFTVVLPHLLNYLLNAIGIADCLKILAAMSSFLMVAALSFKPLLVHDRDDDRERERQRPYGLRSKCYEIFSKVVYLDNWRNAKYVVWCFVVPCALFGYFVPYMHISQYVKDTLDGQDGSVLISCIAATSLLGRLVFGKVVDHHWANGIALQQVAFLSTGVCTMMLVAAQYFHGYTFHVLVGVSLLMGLFDGCFITMFGPIAFEICGQRGASQGIGFILGLSSIPLTVGPMVAGMLHDRYGNYTAAFLLAGVPPVLGAAAMCLIYKVGDGNRPRVREVEEEAFVGEDRHRDVDELRTSVTAATVVEEL